MPFIKIPGTKGLVFVPETTSRKKHDCRDCSHCQWCSENRCNLCRKKTCQKKDRS